MLPETTTDRLLAVADIIEFEEGLWNQACWEGAGIIDDSVLVWPINRVENSGCKTPACVAGWAVRLTPLKEARWWPSLARRSSVLKHDADFETAIDDAWAAAGEAALGLSESLSQSLFAAKLWKDDLCDDSMPNILRRIAKIPEGNRTLDAYINILEDQDAS